MKKLLTVAIVSGMVIGLMAHPHISKTVTAKIGEIEAKLSYYTMPANLEHTTAAAAGSFSQGARLSLSAEMTGSGVTIPAGEYTVGAVKNAEDDWTLALYPGQLGRGESADHSKLIKLTSSFSKEHGVSEHSHLDISPGSGSLEGHTVVTWHFGPYFLAGALN